MCCGSFCEVVQRLSRAFGDLLKYKELGQADANLQLDLAGVNAEGANDPANCVHRPGDIVHFIGAGRRF